MSYTIVGGEKKEAEVYKKQFEEVKLDEIMLNDLDSLVKKYGKYQNPPNHKNANTESDVIVQYGKPNEFNVIPVMSVTHAIDQINDSEKDTDPFIELVESKNDIINELKQEILRLKQEIVDLTLLYNLKIENLRQDHKKELYAQYKEFLKKLKTLK